MGSPTWLAIRSAYFAFPAIRSGYAGGGLAASSGAAVVGAGVGAGADLVTTGMLDQATANLLAVFVESGKNKADELPGAPQWWLEEPGDTCCPP